MATSQTVLANPLQDSMMGLELQPVHKDTEASVPAEVPPVDAVDAQSDASIPKLVVAGFSFFCAGVNDGTLGPLIPYMLITFGIGTGEIAVM